MGQEIRTSHFVEADFARFAARLRQETDLLEEWIRSQKMASSPPLIGCELEACLIDEQACANPINQSFLAQVDSPLVVPELAQFNIEINTEPQLLRAGVLRQMAANLQATWNHCSATARTLGSDLLMIGILPTLQPQELTIANISPLQRYYALNEQVLRLRGGRPTCLDIRGHEHHLRIEHPDIMLESATTSFQIHLQVDLERAVRCYNAAQILSAPLVAVAANSPYLFGHHLWEETRIPLFEQAIDGAPDNICTHRCRVTFGNGYAQESLLAAFSENLENYPVLLPVDLGSDPAQLPHLRLHNGTIWRWNRPLIGFDADGRPHLRIEHRVVPAGPTVADMVANAAFFLGATQILSQQDPAPERILPFELARANFYAAAQQGLEADITWLDGDPRPVRSLLAHELVPLAARGLAQLGLDATDIDHYLGILSERVHKGNTGAVWQTRFVVEYGKDMQQLTREYWVRQQSGLPVHEWDL